jgi:hypothetical protein
VDAVRVALEGEGPVAQVREDRVRDLAVVAEEVALRDAVLGKEDAVGVRELNAGDAGG